MNMEIFFGIVMILLGLGITVLIGFLVFEGADSALLRLQTGLARIEQVEFKAAHEESHWNIALKVPITETIPDTWHLLIHTEHGYGWMQMRHSPWNWQQPESDVLAEYKIGRFSHRLNIKRITAR